MKWAASALTAAALLTPAAAAEPKGRPPERLTVEGYVHVQWFYDLHKNALPRHGFNLRRGRVEFRYDPTDAVGAEIEIGCDRLELAVKNAFIEYRVSRTLGFVAGLRKMPFSREELTSTSRLLMVERSETNDVFGERGYLGRDIGLAVAGEVRAGRLPVTYSAGVFNGNGASRFKDDNDAKQFCERLTVQPLGRLTAGLGATQRNDSLTGRVVTAYGVDLSWRPVRAAVEAEMLVGDAGAGRRMLGCYLVGAYRLGTLEPAVRLERLYPDLGARGDCRTFLTAGLNWHPKKRLQVKTNFVTDLRTGRDPGHELIVQAQAGF